MTDKVLGFRESDAVFIKVKPGLEYQLIDVRTTKLVPVVSVEALKKWCAKEDWKRFHSKKRRYVPVDDLLSWAKKKAVRKQVNV